MRRRNILKVLFGFMILLFFGCNNELEVIDSNQIMTRAITVPDFDWEHADWMPTPPMQAKIPVPWIGQGSISSTFGLEVANDHYKSDGWELLYNSFDAASGAPLSNPYFILYNKFNGIMRVYFYTTTQFLYPSSYLQDGISVLSNKESSLLNFLGESWIDGSVNKKAYSQIQPSSFDGSLPLASNKWYLLQYELAYDSNFSNITWREGQLNCFLNFCNVNKIELGGSITGSIKSGLGTKSNGMASELGKTGKLVGTGVLAAVGSDILKKNEKNADGENSLGISKTVFKALRNGIDGAIKGASSNLPGTIIGLFSSVFSSKVSTNMVNLTVDLDVKLEGNASESGSLPSSPMSFYVPGANMNGAVHYVPKYNKPLGVFNFIGKPIIEISGEMRYLIDEGEDDALFYENSSYNIVKSDYSKYLLFNPEVKNEADVKIKKQEVLVWLSGEYSAKFLDYWECDRKELIGHLVNPLTKDGDAYDQYCLANVEKMGFGYYGYQFYEMPNILSELIYGVRFTIEVTPKNGGATQTIVKTFRLTPDYKKVKKTEVKNIKDL